MRNEKLEMRKWKPKWKWSSLLLVDNTEVDAIVYLSLVPSPLHARARKVWSKGSHFLVLEVRILRPNQVAEPWSHDISGM